MKNKTNINAVAFFAAAALFTLNSCQSSLTISPASENQEFTINSQIYLGNPLLSTLSSLTGQENLSDIFQNQQITQNESHLSLTTKGGNSILIEGTVKNQPFIKKNGNSIEVNFSRTSLEQLYLLFDEESRVYLDLLMAPCFTGDEMSVEEYLDLLATFYGQDIADEIDEAELTVKIQNSSKNEIEKKLKLAEILCCSLTNEKLSI